MKLPSGTEVFDRLLEGGYDKGIITTIYGPAATGKTTACLLATIEISKRGGKVIFIDTENGFSVERLKQLAKEHKNILDGIFLMKVSSFNEQNEKIDFISTLVQKTKIDLVIIDTIGAQYRKVLQNDVKEVNSQMANQLKILTEITKNYSTVVLTNQVYGLLDKRGISPVGGDMLKNYSGCLIELKKFKSANRGAVVRKHKSLKEKEIVFKIEERGFIPL